MGPVRVLVTGSSGFIGSHLAARLKAGGHWVRGADIVPPPRDAGLDEFAHGDLRLPGWCEFAADGVDHVYHLAADMGGMGYISGNHAEIFRSNTLMDVHMLAAAAAAGVSRFLYASSACVYPQALQDSPGAPPLREEAAFTGPPPMEAYGWAKLYGELGCRWHAGGGLAIRIARLHNVYGPHGTWDGGREKAPAALCRKVALADPDGTVEVWGDGQQARSYCYIDDATEGLLRVMAGSHPGAVNVGSDFLITTAGLVSLIARVAGKPRLRIRQVPGPQGVRGRCSDNTLARLVLGWEPSVPLEDGLKVTYEWIRGELGERAR